MSRLPCMIVPMLASSEVTFSCKNGSRTDHLAVVLNTTPALEIINDDKIQFNLFIKLYRYIIYAHTSTGGELSFSYNWVMGCQPWRRPWSDEFGAGQQCSTSTITLFYAKRRAHRSAPNEVLLQHYFRR